MIQKTGGKQPNESKSRTSILLLLRVSELFEKLFIKRFEEVTERNYIIKSNEVEFCCDKAVSNIPDV